MSLALLIGCLTVGILLATQISRPATDSSRQRSASRRAKFVATHPTHVNSADIVAALGREGVPVQQARFITERADEQGIKPFTMWLWLEQFGAEVLGIVVAADLTHEQLLTHISNGTVPDLEELKLFASANGLDVADRPQSDPKRSAPSVKAKKRPPMPPIYEPGSYTGLELAARARRRPDVERLDDSGQGDVAA
ncbi:hypothetical protein [Nocardioides sp.]|jgi:hypothetical protein|uniref:hypothetical protein n=1 Tax=Nocardioides sp. TaxID=35761 RepID=UPI00262F6DEE|nr:hypothetical protein [Nocardioides sp.]